MSWLARSLANSLRLDDDGGDGDDDHLRDGVGAVVDEAISCSDSPTSTSRQRGKEDDDRSDPQGRGVKEDLSEIRETLTRQLWGVASFLAPPPSHPSTPSADPSSVSDWNRWEHSDPSVSGKISGKGDDSDADGASGIRSDIAEIGGRFRTGMSKLSHHRTVSEISRIASNFLPFGPEEEEVESLEEYDFRGVVGVTQEVLTFAKNIAMHPETWLDFPLEEEQEMDDFELSDAQREHALAVEHSLPRLAALRIELCPGHMSEGYFWKVYFVLLHSRLNKHDSELLSTPLVVAARARWMHELRKRTKAEQDWSKIISSYSNDCSNLQHEGFFCSSTYSPILENVAAEKSVLVTTTDIEMDKYPVSSTKTQFIDKSVIEEKPAAQNKDKMIVAGPSYKVDLPTYEDDGDDWLHEDNSELGSCSGSAILLGNEEAVSFSDLEDDDDDIVKCL